MDADDFIASIVFGWTAIAEHDLRAAAERAARATGVTLSRIDYHPELSSIEIACDGKRAWFQLERTEISSDLSIDRITEDHDDARWTTYLEALAAELGGEIDFDEIDRRNTLPGGVGVISYVPPATQS